MGLFPQHPLLSNRVFSNAHRFVEHSENYHIELEAVGILSDDIEIHATENELNIKSPKPELAGGLKPIHRERIHAGLRQKFRFRNAIDPDTISAELNNGLLILTVPKKEPRQVPVSVVRPASEQTVSI
jgi:HSP20 family protein